MEFDPSYDRDEEIVSDSSREIHAPRRPCKTGKHNQEEPTSFVELQQQKNEYYLHPGWKGSRFHHQ